MEIDSSFLGTGWSFPPTFDKKSGTIEMVSEVEDIEQSLQILLATSLGEAGLCKPEFGCDLREYQFEPVTNTLLGLLEDLVRRSILFFEPRILVEEINITEPDDFDIIEGKIIISVEYIIPRTNSRFNFVYDFYLLEADRDI